MWVSTAELLTQLKCSRGTLQALQRAGVLRPGIEYRRMGVGSKAPLQWDPAAVDAALARHTAAINGIEEVLA
jgi:hypothetical protein